MRTSTSLSFLLPVVVSASPVLNPTPLNAVFCKVNNAVLSLLNKDAAATPYCSSYLSIPTSTVFTTATATPSSVYSTIPVTVTGNPVTETQTRTETTSIDVTSTTTQIETAQITTTLTTTSTISCLNSAYTAPVASAGAAKKRGVVVKKPTAIPTDWSAAYVSSACACLAIPTPTTTVTLKTTLVPGTITVYATQVTTPSVTASETTTTTATNTIITTETTTTTLTSTAYASETTMASNGVQYRKYEHEYEIINGDPGYTSTYFKGRTPDFSGALSSLTFSTYNWPSSDLLKLADREDDFAADLSAILMQGFFIAKETGTYGFISSGNDVDNWAYLWTGDVAYSDWNDSNTAFKSIRVSPPFVTGSYSVALKAGDAIPITLLWANGGSAGRNILQIYTPSRATITDHTGYFIQACSSSVFA